MSGRLRVLLLLCCLGSLGAQAQEAIEAFDVRLQVEPNGDVLVTERIAVQAQGRQIVRGIYRDVPTRYSLGKGAVRNTPLTLILATRDGKPEPVVQQPLENGVRLRLGDSTTPLAPGRYLYELQYRMDAQLLHRKATDELYWNVTGNYWRLPILHASVEVLLPEGALIDAAHGYTGYLGDRREDYELVEQQGNRLRMATSRALREQEGFTVAVKWPAGLVARPNWSERMYRRYLDNPRIMLGFASLLGLLLFYGLCWLTVGRGPAKGLIIPLFSAPDGVSPTVASYLWKRGFAGDQRGAQELGILFTDMTIRGLLRMKMKGGNLTLSHGKAPHAPAREVERRVLVQLLPRGQETLPLRGSYEPRLEAALEACRNALKDVEANYFNNHTALWLVGAGFALMACLGLLTSVPNEVAPADDILIAAVFLLAGGTWAFFAFSSGAILSGLAFLLLSLGIMVFLGSMVGEQVLTLCLLLAASVLLFRKLLRAPTKSTRHLLDALAGYREYLSLAERDTLALAGKAPVMSIELYEKHLPYAMALGVEEQWNRRFTAALKQGALAPSAADYQQQWFTDNVTRSETHSLGGILGKVLHPVVTPPPAPDASSDHGSSSDSDSASSGGGSSGGGAGGGGGGGW